ncbi:matrix protein [avian paramyxovirus 14]|uniref:Matrix protein n=1 Tax=avian paramyxovirus 14 TaxID=1928005 RepID=A0A1L5YIM7_9MONO|nr:matrix protein [Avian paramyxovirus 14]APP90892.1 matrix protein [Avian paramyxovirus 14]
MASASVNLFVDESAPSSSLLAFPIVTKDNGSGGKALQPQIRIAYHGEVQGSKRSVMFVNCYGFIEDYSDRNEGFLNPDEPPKPRTVTAACLTIGSVSGDLDPREVARACFDLDVKVKINADSRERVAFSFRTKPALLISSRVISGGGIVLSAEDNIKCVGKMAVDKDYRLRIMFCSTTFLHQSKLFKAQPAVMNLRSSMLLALQVAVTIKVDIPASHPHAKYLSKEGDDLVAHVWIHVCNFKRTDRRGETRTVENLKEKVRRMGLKVSLLDLWGPTIIIEATGTMTKYALGFFSDSKTSCHPISKASPETAKLLWSATGEVKRAVAVIQSSDKRALLTEDDLLVKGAMTTQAGGLKEFSLFKK